MNREIVDFWILSLLIYIVFLLTHDPVWMVLSIVSMIIIAIATVLEIVNAAVTWRKNLRRRQHVKDDVV